VVRSPQGTLTPSPATFRSDLLAIARGAIAAVGASGVVARALGEPRFSSIFSRPVHVIAAGKAAGTMAAAIASESRVRPHVVFAVGTHAPADLPAMVEWHEAAHPIPDARSAVAARRALAIASSVPAQDTLVLLLSGGASALMALPIDGLRLEDKQAVVDVMLRAGADIHALNTVRKHLSAIKGGRLAAACRGHTLTLAISDVIGDDLAVIGSGPGVPDPTTWDEAARLFDRFVGSTGDPRLAAARRVLEEGTRGLRPDTPKPGDPAIARADAAVIASRADALAGAGRVAASRGYHVITLEEPVVGEARDVAPRWLERCAALAARHAGPVCVLSAGETTVRVRGRGRGGRNQEFALALTRPIARDGLPRMAASIGTDGIDGPTDAAGALVDHTTLARAADMGQMPEPFLDDNDAYAFFACLGDLVHLGRTDTNVGDLQVLLAA
jgi:hydroxypyruvate reductase